MAGRGRTPNMLVGLRIALYVTLVLTSEINATNSKMQGRGQKKHYEVAKSGVSDLEVDGKTDVKIEVDSKVRMSLQLANIKNKFSHLWADNNKLGSHLKHSKTWVSSLDTHDGQLRLDRQRTQIEVTGKMLKVKDCPAGCDCAQGYVAQQPTLRVSDCQSDPVSSLPKLFYSHQDITVLWLMRCHLTTLPPEITKLPLIAVQLTTNEFTKVPQELLELPQLQYLYMMDNKLKSLPADVTKWSAMIDVKFDHNLIEELPQEIGVMRNLHTLILSYNALQSLPNSLSACAELEFLDISNNKLSSVPQSIVSLVQLKYLDISNNDLSSVPQSIVSLVQLRILDISNNDLSSVPQSIGSLLQLVYLDISNNDLSSVPQSIGSLVQLKMLDISNNKLSSVPQSIGSLLRLEMLLISNNNLQSPPQVASLRNLGALYLSNNPLGVVPTLPTQSLVEFYCINCSIQMLPCTVFTEGHIGILSLGNNGIRNADCGDKQNDYLFYLNLQHNFFQEVPCEFNAAVLRTFDISYNNVSILPKNCLLLTHQFLEKAHFDHNKINILHFSSFCAQGSDDTLNHISFGSNRISTIDTSDSPLHKCFTPGAVIDLGSNMLSMLDSWPMLLSQSKSIKLNVSNNYLSHFTSSFGRFFHPSQLGSVFSMQGNQIKHFMDIFNGWKIIVNTSQALNALLKDTIFDLGYNPLVCDCVDYEVYKNIQRLPLENYKNLLCQEPQSLRGQNPYNISLVNFVCDIDMKCPDGCTCSKVPHSQTVDVTCLNYNKTDIPEIVPDLPKLNYKYQIDIRHQTLHEISARLYLYETTEIRLSNNSIKMINSSTNFQSVKILLLNDNLLQRLPESVSSLTNNTEREIRLGGNPWICDCEALSMKKWLTKYWTFIKDMDDIQCGSPNSMKGKKVVDITEVIVCPGENRTAVYVVAAISSAVFIFLMILYYHDPSKIAHFRLIGRDECDGEGKEFDIFMCACSADEDADYVENYLIHELERRDFKVLYHKEHFHPGKPIHINMSEALAKSKRTLVFFSNSFRESNFGMFEFHSAYDMDCRNNTKRLITIKDRNLDMNKLEGAEVEYFQKHTILDRDSKFFWKLLLSALPRKRLGGHVVVRHRGLIN